MAKVTFNLPDEVVNKLDQLAQEQSVSKTEALRRAISTEDFVRQERGAGNEIVIGRPGGKSRRVRFSY
jgi:predicted transcriptional regulator